MADPRACTFCRDEIPGEFYRVVIERLAPVNAGTFSKPDEEVLVPRAMAELLVCGSCWPEKVQTEFIVGLEGPPTKDQDVDLGGEGG